jgi:WD repeat-containing protein 23
MSSSQVPTSPPSEGGDPRTIVYDPNDPFWRDTEDDDDDMDYLPARGGSEEDGSEEADLSFHGRHIVFDNGSFIDSNQFTDAAERLSHLSGVEIAFEYTDDNDEDEDEDDDEDGEDEENDDEDDEENEEGEASTADGAPRPVYITREQIMQLLGHAGLGRIFASDLIPRGARRRNLRRVEEDDDDDEEEDSDPGTGYDAVGPGRTLRNRRPRGRAAFDKVPSEQGRELMSTGAFGSSPRPQDTIKRKKRLAYDIMRRSLGLGSEGRQKNATRLLRQDMIPESVADTIIHYESRCYSGQFSDDGNFFFSCAQDFRVRMYDTSNPYDWKYYKVSLSLGYWAHRLTFYRQLYTLMDNGRSQTHR